MSVGSFVRRHRIPLQVGLAVAVVVALVLVIARSTLLRSPAEPPERYAAPGHAHAEARLPDAALEYLRAAFQSYEAARATLADDSLEGLAERGTEIAAALHAAAAPAGEAGEELPLHEATEAAARLSKATTIEDARKQFGQLSRFLLALAEADPRLREGWHVFSCPMETGFQKWIQRSDRLENPYMGARMLACGAPADWEDATIAEARPAADPSEISHYTCAMHPSVQSDAPGQCPICGMDLTPVTRAEAESGTVIVDEVRRAKVGIKTAKVTRGPMDLSFRALGKVVYDETTLHDVTLKLDGYIHSLRVNATGQAVKRGEVLFTLYSPELYAAQEELLLTGRAESEAGELVGRAARRRLELWGITSAQVSRILENGKPMQNVPFVAPASGYVIEKNVVEGAAVKAGERLFRIAPLDRVWVEADVYEQDLAQVKVGQKVAVTLPFLPGKQYEGRVAFVYPTLDEKTRTGRIRVELPNEDLALKPDMFADVRFDVSGGERLQIPESAVIFTGPRRLVFVDIGDGKLKPQEVRLGVRGAHGYEVLEGLREGDVVVTSGNFLIAAESRIRSTGDAIGAGGSAGGDHAGH